MAPRLDLGEHPFCVVVGEFLVVLRGDAIHVGHRIGRTDDVGTGVNQCLSIGGTSLVGHVEQVLYEFGVAVNVPVKVGVAA